MSEQSIKINYSGNSHKERDAKASEAKAEESKPEPRVQPIEGVSATTRKKPLGRKIAETFTGDDMQSVGNHIFFDVIIPAAKNMLFDVVSQGAERALFGTSTRRLGNGVRTISKPQTAYNKVSSGATINPAGTSSNTVSRRVHDFEDLVFDDRGIAEEVLESLRNLVEEYGNAKIADLKELCNKPSEFTENKWGWDDLRDARVRPTRGGYYIDFPRAIQVA